MTKDPTKATPEMLALARAALGCRIAIVRHNIYTWVGAIPPCDHCKQEKVIWEIPEIHTFCSLSCFKRHFIQEEKTVSSELVLSELRSEFGECTVQFSNNVLSDYGVNINHSQFNY